MSSTPDVTRTIFDASKRYLGGKLQGNAPNTLLHDWDLNENIDEQVWFLLKSLSAVCGNSFRLWSEAGKSLQPTQSDVAGANIKFTAGNALVGGRPVIVDAAFNYNDESVNFITRGRLATITEIVAGSAYKFTDSEKVWSSDYSLVGCRLKMLEGALSGSYFTITTLAGQQVAISGDLSTAAVDDEYIILPPAITTTGAVEDLFLVTWFEDISEIEDELYSSGGVAVITDPNSAQTPSHRRQLRWCIHLDWQGSSGTDVLSDHIALKIAEIDLTANSTVVNADIADEDYAYTLDKSRAASDVLTGAVSDNSGLITTLTSKTSALFNQDFAVAPFYEFKWDIDGTTTINLNSNFRLFSPLSNADTDSYYLVSGDGSGSGTGAITNSATQSSYFKIDLANDGTGPVGATLGALTNTNSATIAREDLAVLAIHANASTSVVERSMPMGYIPQKQGLDWVLFDDGGSHKSVRIMPGQIWSGAQIYQNPLQTLILDADDVAAHVQGSVPADAWSYLYAFPSSTSERTLTFKFDTKKPKWNGEHRELQGWCLGVVRFATSTAIPGAMRGDTFWFDHNHTYILYTETVSSDVATGGAFLIAPPTGISELNLIVRNTINQKVDAVVYATPTLVNDADYGATVDLDATDFTASVTLPGTMGDYSIDATVASGSGTLTVRMTGYRWDFNYTPDLECWED